MTVDFGKGVVGAWQVCGRAHPFVVVVVVFFPVRSALGELMTQAQDVFDQAGRPVCPSQLTAPLLHSVLQHPALQPHV